VVRCVVDSHTVAILLEIKTNAIHRPLDSQPSSEHAAIHCLTHASAVYLSCAPRYFKHHTTIKIKTQERRKNSGCDPRERRAAWCMRVLHTVHVHDYIFTITSSSQYENNENEIVGWQSQEGRAACYTQESCQHEQAQNSQMFTRH
jgi:hypothetical protein